jgi:hypothetical protein
MEIWRIRLCYIHSAHRLDPGHGMKLKKLLCLALIVSILSRAVGLLAAEAFRVGFPSLATGFAPSWVAADKGIWKKHGLDVELIFLRGGSRTVSALIGGSVDLIIGSDLGVTTAILQGASLTRVGATTNTLGYSMVTQPNIKTIRDLKGKIIGITQDATPLMPESSSCCATTVWTRARTSRFFRSAMAGPRPEWRPSRAASFTRPCSRRRPI